MKPAVQSFHDRTLAVHHFARFEIKMTIALVMRMGYAIEQLSHHVNASLQ
jgi:hypothetical protein